MRNWIWACISIAVMGCALSVVAVAADVSGKWRAEFTTPDGTQRINTFTFKVDGNKLTGTVAGAQGASNDASKYCWTAAGSANCAWCFISTRCLFIAFSVPDFATTRPIRL